jgi:hypothetical protein
VALAALGVAGGVIGFDRWLDVTARRVDVGAFALGAGAPAVTVAPGENVLVVLRNDSADVRTCGVAGVPRVELVVRPGSTRGTRFSLPAAGHYALTCGTPDEMSGGSTAGMGAALVAVTFEVR